eukprot:TRINITY_DN5070_c0_g1_i1.p1 TRINITY_DN5070_c0_g1~~TRINITY_DN5070_c0_g1_i1.p1  ORF type:complete len:56 (+),score=0.10 TRINITY_DN5070_c0_g1_i1:66-233(+)
MHVLGMCCNGVCCVFHVLCIQRVAWSMVAVILIGVWHTSVLKNLKPCDSVYLLFN